MNIRSIFLYLLLINSSMLSVVYRLTRPSYDQGLFSIFHTVLGVLDFYENSSECTGLILDFEDQGLYYDPQYGLNWWEYYFEPIRLCSYDEQLKEFSTDEKVGFSYSAHFEMSRERGNDLIQKYIHLKPHLQHKLDAFIQKYFAGNHVVGVHYRGTDKKLEAPTVAYKEVADRINQEMRLHDHTKIFVATDDENFLLFMHKKFPGKIIALDSIRSRDENPVHSPYHPENAYRKGEEAVLDCLLLSRCAKLYKMSSNLSDCSVKFNPSIPVVNLNQCYYQVPATNQTLLRRVPARGVSERMWLL